MGCTTSVHVNLEMGRSEKTMKAAVLIQRWYRRYVARLEARRRATWAIFTTIEYAGEQDHLKLHNFFSTMLEQFSPGHHEHIMKAFALPSTYGEEVSPWSQEDDDLLSSTDPSLITVDPTYNGPHLTWPLTKQSLVDVLAAFRDKKVMHAKYLLEILHASRKQLMTMPNINKVSTTLAGHVTICGDLHGKLDDLYTVFQKNGLPSVDNPYLFNGDFVDRGRNSAEVIILLLMCVIKNPNQVFLNRGNHEDHAMNVRYGFTKEIIRKYKRYSVKVLRMFNEVFRWLPLATVIDDRVLVVHGGLSDIIDLEFISGIERHKYISVLRPSTLTDIDHDMYDEVDIREFEEWRQLLDLLWSDPRSAPGSVANTFRGGGSYFGPDITHRILESHGLQLLIRSHQCVEEGYMWSHGDKVLTVFSASNYYDENSNKGAYVKFMAIPPGGRADDLRSYCHIVQYMAPTKAHRKLTFTERISHLERSALTTVRSLMIASRSQLEREFKKYDPEGTGVIHCNEWCKAMEVVMSIDVPWRLLRSRLVGAAPHGKGQLVLYETTFTDRRISFKNIESGEPSVTESLYRHKDVLETIFRTFDRDGSGRISMSEFTDACQILARHSHLELSPIEISEIATSLDFNKDGQIDFNEFLEAFRIVDTQGLRYQGQSLSDVLENTEEENSLSPEFRGTPPFLLDNSSPSLIVTPPCEDTSSQQCVSQSESRT